MTIPIRHWLNLIIVCVALQAIGAAGVAAQTNALLPDDIDETFAVSSMHRPFIPDAPAVVRLDTRRFVVHSEREAVERVRRAVTILKPEGKQFARLVLPYDKFHHIDRLEGRIRDANGKVIRKLGDDDQRDLSAISDISLYEERRMRIAELFHSTYPYTVEFEYAIERDGLIGWPSWRAQERKVPVEYTAFEIAAPAWMPIRYTVENGEWAPDEGTTADRHWKRWTATHIEKAERVSYGPPWGQQVTTIHTAPSAFEIEEAPGQMDTWTAFGRWYYRLSQGRAQLPEATAQEVQTMAAAASDTAATIRALYRFMQDKTRYVSVQLGIGGWQPFPASYVDERSYGDCKALTNYMYALLKEAGIDAHPVLIRAGRDAPPIRADFPSHQFNHVILAVPVAGDTLWLENTDQTTPFGHVSAFIEDRHGLLVSEAGGQLVRTPRSTAAGNAQHRRATVQLDAAGNAHVTVRTTYTGNQQDRVRHALVESSTRDRQKWVRDQIDIPNFTLRTTDFASVDQRQPTIELPLVLDAPRYGSQMGKRIFFQPNIMQRWTHVPPADDALRNVPIRFSPYPFLDTDSIAYALPDGYEVEALPEPVDIETSFARYKATATVQDGGAVVYRRRMELTAPTLPPEQYDAFRSFLRQVAQADRKQIVLVEEKT